MTVMAGKSFLCDFTDFLISQTIKKAHRTFEAITIQRTSTSSVLNKVEK
jgi:hypothetical protein